MKTVATFKELIIKIATKIKNHALTSFTILSVIIAIITSYAWFVHTYAMTPLELLKIMRLGLSSLEGLDQLPGYLEVTDLPGYLEARKNTVEIIRETVEERGFQMYDLVKLAKCESTINPAAYNYSSGATGLFQFKPTTWNTTPQCHEDIWDAESQTKATIWMFEHSRYREWECFRQYELKQESPYPRDYFGCK